MIKIIASARLLVILNLFFLQLRITFNTEGKGSNNTYKPEGILMEIHQKDLGRHNREISWEQTHKITNGMTHDFTFKGSIFRTVRTNKHLCDIKNQAKHTKCFNNYYMSKLNCSFPWMKESLNDLPKCGANDKVQDLVDLIIKIDNEDPETLDELQEIGCTLENCKIAKWQPIKFHQKSNTHVFKNVTDDDGTLLKETKVGMFFQAVKMASTYF